MTNTPKLVRHDLTRTRTARMWLNRELQRTGRTLEAMNALLQYHQTILRTVDDPMRSEQVALLKQMIAEKLDPHAKAMRVRMMDADKKIYFWTVRPDAPNKGWIFIDHDGVERFVEGDWAALVERFRLVASNYGFYTNIS